MEEEVPITDFNRLIGTIAGVLSGPYTSFIARLHSEGRVTDAEMESLRREYQDRVEHLGDLVADGLKRNPDTAWLPPPPNQL